MFEQFIGQLSAQIHLLEHTVAPTMRLRQATKTRQLAQALEFEAIRLARADGVSWGSIGMLNGTSKQAAQTRYERMLRRDPR